MEPLLVSTRDACAILGIGPTSLYQLISLQRLDSRKIGRRRLITMASIRAMVDGGASVSNSMDMPS